MPSLARTFLHDDAGQGLVEYGLIVTLIALIAIVGLTLLREKSDNSLFNSANHLKGSE